MFGSLKEKLKSFFSKKEEKKEVEEVIEIEEKLEKEKPKPEKKEKVEEKSEKVKITKKAETTPSPEQAPEETLKTKIAKLPKKQKKYPEKKTPEKEKLEKEKPVKEGTLKEKQEELGQENKQELDYTIDELEEEVEENIEKKQEIKEKAEPEKKGFFARFKSKMSSTTLTQEMFNEFFENLEMLLLENNVALSVVDQIRTNMEKDLLNIEIKKSDIENEIKTSLKNSIKNILVEPFDLIGKIKSKKEKEPFVILFFGINGSGKTTTIAKIANLLKENKIQCVLAAGDTFRAASIEQLRKHGDKLGIKVISQTYGSDPAAVGFDAIQYAKSHGIKAVLIDTAGRMHTKNDLLREMEKIVRVTNPDLKIFVAESITGNDATEQAKKFSDAFGLDASILTKADVDEKGGTAISIGYVTGKPIIFLGTGQEYKNLEEFSPEEIVENLGLD